MGAANTCAGGDSGAGWFNDSTPPQVVGLLVAGSGPFCYANQATAVLSLMGLTMDHSACPESCPAIDLSSGTDDRSGYVARFYRLRDEVLGQSEQGKTWIRRFYEVSPTWVALYATNPALLVATTKNLMSNGLVLEAVAHQMPITVSRSRLGALLAVLDQHIAATETRSSAGPSSPGKTSCRTRWCTSYWDHRSVAPPTPRSFTGVGVPVGARKKRHGGQDHRKAHCDSCDAQSVKQPGRLSRATTEPLEDLHVREQNGTSAGKMCRKSSWNSLGARTRKATRNANMMSVPPR